MSRSTIPPASASTDRAEPRTESALARLFAPADPASLACFRIGFGALLLLEIWRYLAGDRISRYFLEPAFHFTYYGFGWVRPWPGVGLYVHFAILGVAAAAITAGLFHRAASLVFAVGFAYVFLLEKALYLNHFYLIVLLSILLAFVPAGAAHSVESWRKREARPVPRWSIGLLRTQIGLVYFFAGVAKLNADWLRAEPLLSWLEERSTLPLIGPLVAQDAVAWTFSYGAIVLDLCAWPLLAAKRTRAATFVVIIAFHVANSILFNIGIFPWMMIVATTLFFEPDWPRRWLRADGSGGLAPLPAPTRARKRLVVALLVSWFTVQALVPLRHLLYPGNVAWTEEGHAFSWRMKLRGKNSEVTYLVTDPETGEAFRVDPSAELAPFQAGNMGGRPDLILQYAHRIAARERERGRSRVEVRAFARTSLNGRKPATLVDPTVDLAAEKRSLLRPARWILPLEE